MPHPEGESLKVGFDGCLKLEFHGSKVTSDAGLLAYRDLDEALGLFDSSAAVFFDPRTGRSVQHDIPSLLRQTVYSRLAGDEDGGSGGFQECLRGDTGTDKPITMLYSVIFPESWKADRSVQTRFSKDETVDFNAR